ncbi:hypothetical protein GCM10009836_21140 [Pseudonocardia ailaonensis]|uniref:DUF2277 domain-containing protein n=1 Tax=Pseudonocardia ailaonensis TaxID=367279 RepID=A0ABN2MWY4_9PSEU
MPRRVPVDRERAVCRNIRTLHNFEPPATEDEVHAAALQFVRKVSGATRPSQANAEAFERAVAEIAHVTRHLLDDLVSTAPPKDREIEAEKAKARAAVRYAR